MSPVDARAIDAWALRAGGVLLIFVMLLVAGNSNAIEAATAHRGSEQVLSQRMRALRVDADEGTFTMIWDVETRHGFQQWVGRRGPAGFLWRVELPGEIDTHGPEKGIAMDDERILVRYSRDEGHVMAVRALSKSSGALLWDTEIERQEGEHRASFSMYLGIATGGHQVLAALEDTIVTLDSHTGAVVSVDVLPYAHALQRGGGRIVASTFETSLEWRGFPAAPTRLSGDLICKVDDRLVSVSAGWEGPHRITALGRGHVRDLEWPDDSRYGRVLSCGDYDGSLVLLVAFNMEREHRVLVFRKDGSLRHVISVPGHAFSGEHQRRRFPDNASYSGDLPRFVLETAVTRDSRNTLAMLDLETGAVAWRADDVENSGSVFRVDTAWFWVTNAFRPTVVRFDGTTGDMTGAVELHLAGGVREVAPPSAALGSFWVHSDMGVETLDVSRLDARTLEVFGPLSAVDSTQAMRQQLGLR
ncbi:MAG: hypothetical protein JWP01_1409 [Myxococcales bacterium]|nr:hypothetical protein [Myxococcales bacterium]